MLNDKLQLFRDLGGGSLHRQVTVNVSALPGLHEGRSNVCIIASAGMAFGMACFLPYRIIHCTFSGAHAPTGFLRLSFVDSS
jgi:hypothetical protein